MNIRADLRKLFLGWAGEKISEKSLLHQFLMELQLTKLMDYTDEAGVPRYGTDITCMMEDLE